MRYTLLPYLYTLLADAEASGALVARPLWVNFPEDSATHGIDEQFMLGSALLVSPVLTQGATSVNAYFPNGTWYSLFGILNEYDTNEDETQGLAQQQPYPVEGSQTMTLDTPLTASNVHVRAGSILPLHTYGAMTTTEALSMPNRLLVVFDGLDGAEAQGHAFYDDGGDEADSTNGRTVTSCSAAAGKGVSCVVEEDTFAGAADRQLDTIVVVGAFSSPKTINLIIQGMPSSSPDFKWDADRMRLTVDLSGHGVALNTAFSLRWEL